MHTFNEPTPHNPELGPEAFVTSQFDGLLAEADEKYGQDNTSRVYSAQDIGVSSVEAVMLTSAVKAPKEAYQLFALTRTNSEHGARYDFMPVNPSSFGDYAFPLVHAERDAGGQVTQLEGRTARIRERASPLQIEGAFAPADIAQSVGMLRVVTPRELGKHREWQTLTVRIGSADAGSRLAVISQIEAGQTAEKLSGKEKATHALGSMASTHA